MLRSIAPFLFALFNLTALAQQTATVYGTVRDEQGSKLEGVAVSVAGGKSVGVLTDSTGHFELQIPAGIDVTLRFNYAGADLPGETQVFLTPGDRHRMDYTFGVKELTKVDVGVQRDRMARLDPKPHAFMPTMGGVESLLGGLVVSRNELSSGYSVRGGNFDENLVYVNDIEVYRPFLVRAGQQEGLSFPNPDLISNIRFSAGGWDARYGDKMSSVLDIQYKRPKEFAGSVVASLLGGSVSLESAMLKKRLRQVTGFRYRTLQSVLSGLDTQGEYEPRYLDLQTYWTYDLTDKVELGFLGVYSRNKYNVIPQSRETEFGVFNQALRFTVYFDGQTQTEYETFFGAINANVKASKDLLLKFTASAFNTFETERFDIQGQYFLGELERDPTSDQYGEVVSNLGVGTYLEHGRNELDATVISLTHKAVLQRENGDLRWGIDARSEVIHDKLSEWTMIDSADFSIPYTSDPEQLELGYSLKSRLNLESVRTSAYLQRAWRWNTGERKWWELVAGVRAQYWTYDEQTVVSPRTRITWHPGWTKATSDSTFIDRDYSFWFATGVYYQPPFYRELRRPDGTLNPDIVAQQSIHFVLGMDRLFNIWNRNFKFVAEAYYKSMTDLIPYEVDNVRIRYYGENMAKGFATGLDMKLNGEFIKGIESWAGLNVMATYEDLDGDSFYRYYNADGERTDLPETVDRIAVDSIQVEAGFIPRPTDQRVNFNLFFQDEMPQWPTFKVHLNLVFGTAVPYGPPNYNRYADTLRTSLYRRVDIGFSKQFIGGPGQKQPKNFLGGLSDLYLSLEIFNLLNINNIIDYTWVEDVQGRYYAIPEFLTPRRFNLKLVAHF